MQILGSLLQADCSNVLRLGLWLEALDVGDGSRLQEFFFGATDGDVVGDSSGQELPSAVGVSPCSTHVERSREVWRAGLRDAEGEQKLTNT